MANFPATIALSTLSTLNGFKILGEGNPGTLGLSVSSAGDINGDGFADIILGGGIDGPNGQGSGISYVIFGQGLRFPASFQVSSLNGVNGFQINGEEANDNSGHSVASAGDVNGDGYDDLIIGARYADTADRDAGASYVVFGKAAGFTADLDLTSLDGTNGFQINGEAFLNNAGEVVASAGDLNGDGYADLVIGTGSSRTAYVVFGGAQFDANVDLSSLDGSNGLQINGDVYSGSVASAGDVNGDGLADLLVGAPLDNPDGAQTGGAYVIFGKSSGFSAELILADLDGSDGFRIAGENLLDQLGVSVDSAGDFNGDGYDDIIVGRRATQYNQYTGGAYLVFGKAGGFAAEITVADLDGVNGFRFAGEPYNRIGLSVASAGDVDGDGFGDLILGQYSGTAAAYVVLGRAASPGAVLDLTALDGTNGFVVESNGNLAGYSVASAGDINGDGSDDLVIGAPLTPNAGAAWVIYGKAFAGSGGDDVGRGGAGDNALSGLAGKDILYGLAGDDTLRGDADNDILYGGEGADALFGGLGGDILYGDAGVDNLAGDDGADKLFGGAGADQLSGGLGADRMAGEADIDTLNGGAGNDYLDGGAGADIMTGGADNDVYIVDDSNDQTIELTGGGYDIVRTAVDGWALAADLEGLELQGSADIDGAGNDGANNLQGNRGANTLSGGLGVDTLNGNDGDDIIVGGLGNDLLRGGLGADAFAVRHVASGVLETDQIYDFSDAEGDYLDLTDAFAGTLNQVAAFSKVAGQMTLTFAAGITTVRLDTNGDGKADYQVKINGDVTGDSGGWML